MRASTRFDSKDAFLRHRRVLNEEFSILFRVDIICHDTDAVMRAERAGQCLNESSLTGADRTGHADFHIGHREPSFSCLLIS